MDAAPDLRAYIRDIPDFPTPGIVFRDMTPLLLDAGALRRAIDLLAADASRRRPDFVVAAEARGFVLGVAIAERVGAGFVPARKPGKLPHDTVSAQYLLEYGLDALELHSDALAAGPDGPARVLVHDELTATGGTASALCALVEGLGAEVVGCLFLVELAFLGGREQLEPRPVDALVSYEAA